MEINNNKVVSIIYNLHHNDKEGELMQEVKTSNPYVFLFGSKQVLPEFETNLDGKKKGDQFSFSIKSDDSYGDRDEEQIADLPINIFMVDGKLAEPVKVGHYVPLNDKDGNAMQGLVLEITEEHVKIDFNHPMAGMDLYFEGEINDVREATTEEIEHGHVHGPEGHQH
ncbi:MAG: peptidylprolyl isomerase [Cyclobacteriaceae bacterium]|nr:peptidylprolyl isomerase [Cyclobacteriaceae bacterium]